MAKGRVVWIDEVQNLRVVVGVEDNLLKRPEVLVERRTTDAMGERFWAPTGALDRDWALTAAVVTLSRGDK